MTHHAGNFSPKKLAQYKQLECDVSLQNDARTITHVDVCVQYQHSSDHSEAHCSIGGRLCCFTIN